MRKERREERREGRRKRHRCDDRKKYAQRSSHLKRRSFGDGLRGGGRGAGAHLEERDGSLGVADAEQPRVGGRDGNGLERRVPHLCG